MSVMTPDTSNSPVAGSPAAHARVLIVEDHEVLTHCLSLTLRMEGIEPIVPTSLDDDVVLATTRELHPDVVLLDLNLGSGRTSISLVAPLVELGARVMVLTGSPDEGLQGAALAAGAHGVFLKHGSLEDLCRTITELTAGEAVLRPADRDQLIAAAQLRADAVDKVSRLSHREREVLAALVEGQSAETISANQFVALGTIRSHIRAILRKLEVSSQLAAVAVARRAGYPPL
jgi:DNA-binding NarL/FixJ family response regulator